MIAIKGTPIQDWLNKQGENEYAIRDLAAENNVSTQSIYRMINSARHIRVYKGALYEIKKLGGKK